jgi:hypothetical protein
VTARFVATDSRPEKSPSLSNARRKTTGHESPHTPKTLNPIAPDFPLAAAALAPLRAKAERENRSDFSPLRPGQNASACRVTNAADLTRRFIAEAQT